MAAEPRFSELMFEAGTDRLLAAPLYARGKLIGIIDMRDKAGKLPFESADVPKAQHIADRMVELLADKPIFGHRFITLSKLIGKHQAVVQQGTTESGTYVSPDLAPAPVAPPAPPPPAAPPKLAEVRAYVPRLATLVIDARTIAGRILVATPQEIVGEN